MGALNTPCSQPPKLQSNQALCTLFYEMLFNISISLSATYWRILTILIFLHFISGLTDSSPAMLVNLRQRCARSLLYPILGQQCLLPPCTSPIINPTGTFTFTLSFRKLPSSIGIPSIPPVSWTLMCNAMIALKSSDGTVSSFLPASSSAESSGLVCSWLCHAGQCHIYPRGRQEVLLLQICSLKMDSVKSTGVTGVRPWLEPTCVSSQP
jgi:hypothetical protein